jgi:Skp family chaperone for outer membrane proteins
MLAVGVILSASMAPAFAQQEELTPQMPAADPAQSGAQLPTSTITAPSASTDPLVAQVLTLDQDMLYLSSDWGIRTQAQLDSEGDIIAAENERLTELLSSEEARLTEQRATLPPAEFRTLAENFDLRATEVRRERAQAVQQLNSWAEADRSAFFRAALPIMGRIMQERGAVAVLDRRTLLVSLDAIDVTDSLILELNDSIGDGKGAVPLPQEDDASGQAGDPVAEQGE